MWRWIALVLVAGCAGSPPHPHCEGRDYYPAPACRPADGPVHESLGALAR